MLPLKPKKVILIVKLSPVELFSDYSVNRIGILFTFIQFLYFSCKFQCYEKDI